MTGGNDHADIDNESERRRLGLTVEEYFQQLAEIRAGDEKQQIADVLAQLREGGRENHIRADTIERLIAARKNDTGPKHPVWDGSETLDMTNDLNQRAEQIMIAFYLGQGFSESPEWQELGDDFRFGFRSVVRAIDRGEIPRGTY